MTGFDRAGSGGWGWEVMEEGKGTCLAFPVASYQASGKLDLAGNTVELSLEGDRGDLEAE